MTEYLPFIVAGLVTGAVYGLAGVGLVLTYKTSGVFNFAHGALATVAAYVFYVLNVEHAVSWPVAAACAVFLAAPVMGVVLELITRRIATAGLAHQVSATVGLLLAVEAGTDLLFDPTVVRVVPAFLTDETFRVLDTNVQWADVIVFAFSIVVTAALALFFRTSRTGLQMRAVVDNPELLSLFGGSPAGTRRLAWVLGSMLVAASGVLFAPLLPLNPLQLTLLVVAAFGAAAIGSFSSLPLTLVGGLLIGVLASLSTKWFTTGVLSGVPVSLPFIVLFAVLLLFPKRRLAGKAFTVARSRATWSAPASVQLVSGALVIALLATVPSFAGVRLTAWTVAVASVLVFLSLSLLVRTSGQVSLAHVSFTAIGAAAFSHLAVDHEMPWLVALLLAGLIAVPIGAVLAIPAIRLTGLYLALATFGFGILLQNMFYSQDYMFGATGLGLSEPRPGWSWVDVQSDEGYYYLVLTFVAVATGLVIWLNKSRLGRLMRGLADSPMAVATSGAEVNVTRVMVFCLSAFLAAVGGALAAVAQTTVNGDSYQPLTSLIFFVVVMIVLGGEPWNAVIASASFFLVPAYLATGDVVTWTQVAFGVTGVAVALLPAGAGEVPEPVRRMVDRLSRRRVRSFTAPAAGLRPTVEPGALEVRGLDVRFGGVQAVAGVSLTAPTGSITGLIGPNGAGKTTTFNACSGLNRPASGTVVLDGHDLTGRGPAHRARRGLGRTFQKMELFESLTVRENVAIGADAARSGFNPLSHIFSNPVRSRRAAAYTQQAIEMCALTELAERPVSALSTGQRRLVELARCLAGDFRILLLDEPSSGLDHAETEFFGAILKNAVAQRGLGILLVEHDMSLVLDVCQHIYVLDFGKPIFDGSPEQVVASPIVRAAYLGDAEVEAVVEAVVEVVTELEVTA
jgi:ABC-type branched-subunit amino acid transport system ATPase component/branched-subunit amino acid ABC-type transport system permease component